jgi:chemotaxis response regulator CheB
MNVNHLTPPSRINPADSERVVVIGTAMGGTEALQTVLVDLPAMSPGIVIVQHMPSHFTAAFAARLDGMCKIEVREARHCDRVVPGCALIAPGGRHIWMLPSGSRRWASWRGSSFAMSASAISLLCIVVCHKEVAVWWLAARELGTSFF